MPTLNYSAFHPCLERVSATSRTAVYGPVCTVVWEGRSREAPPYPDRPALEVADIFRDHGPAWREANRGHVSLDQLKVMSAIERCRTAALGGHVARCENAA